MNEQTIILCLLDDEHPRCFEMPTDVQTIDASNFAQIMNGSVSSDDQLTIKDAKCIYCSLDEGCVILEIDGGFYPGSWYCVFAE